MIILNWNKYNESIYSAAASIADRKYSQPARNDEYKVTHVRITYPDDVKVTYKVASENYYSNITNYIISPIISSSHNSTSFERSIVPSYLEIFGDHIQMSDYEEYVFVRCWNTHLDFIENSWTGYLSGKDGKFIEVDMEFFINDMQNWMPIISSGIDCKYFTTGSLAITLSNYKADCRVINYESIKAYTRKLEKYLFENEIDIKHFPLNTSKVDDVYLSSILYAMQTYKYPGRVQNIYKTLNEIDPTRKYHNQYYTTTKILLDLFDKILR